LSPRQQGRPRQDARSRPIFDAATGAGSPPVTETRQQLGGISPTTFYALVKEGELSVVKIGLRSFVHAEELDDFLGRRRYDRSG